MSAIDVKTKITVEGHRFKIHILGEDTENPAIIFVHGGPGIPSRQAVITKLGGFWTKFCTLVSYDQRGTGGSYYSARTEDMTVAQMVADLDGIVDYTIKTLGVEKVMLLCGSWGTVIGINYIHLHPEKVAAYIGSGQMVNGYKNEELSYQFVLDAARTAGDEASVAVLKRVGPPQKGCYRPVRQGLRMQRQVLSKYGGSTMQRKGIVSGTLRSLLSPEMSLGDKWGAIQGYPFSMDALWEKMIGFDFNADRTRFGVPVFILQGRHDFTTPSPIVEPWFDKIEAPAKRLVWFEHSAHGPLGEEMELYTEAVQTIIAEHLPSKKRDV